MGGIVTSEPGDFGMPGLSPRVDMKTRNFIKDVQSIRYSDGFTIEKDTVDAGSTPQTLLRPGLILVRVETGPNKGKYVQFGHADSPNNTSIKDAVILANYPSMLDKTGTAVDKQGLGVYAGRVIDDQIIYPADGTAKAAVKAILNLVQFVPNVA